MDGLELIEAAALPQARIEEYRAAYRETADRARVTLDPARIPGLDHLERFETVSGWLAFCREMEGKISWFASVRRSRDGAGDGRIVGFVCLRHRREYDDDDFEFSSHIGYSIRPDERGKGYGKEQLRLALGKAKELGLARVRIVCLAANTASEKTSLACGGEYLDSLTGEESGLTVRRYDVRVSS